MELLTTIFRDFIAIYSLVLPRLIAIFAMVAFMSQRTLGGTLTRNGILLSLALILHPVISVEVVSLDALPRGILLLIIIKEAFIGVIMGFMLALIFWAIEAVGAFIDNQRGATMASAMDPLSGDQSSPMGTFFMNTMIAIFFITGLFSMFMSSVYESYKIWPVSSFFPTLNFDLVFFLLKYFGQIVFFAVLLGAPIIIAMFVAEFGLMLIGRFAPQLNIFFVSMSVKSAVSNFMLVLFLAIMVTFFSTQLGELAGTYAELNEVWSKQ